MQSDWKIWKTDTFHEPTTYKCWTYAKHEYRRVGVFRVKMRSLVQEIQALEKCQFSNWCHLIESNCTCLSLSIYFFIEKQDIYSAKPKLLTSLVSEFRVSHRVLSHTESYLTQSPISHRDLSHTETYLTQRPVSHRVLSHTESYITQRPVSHRVLSHTESCLT